MRINIGVPAYFSNGEKGLPVDRVIIEPRMWEVTHIVVREGPGAARHRLVPVSMVQSWANDRVILRLTADELADMPEYIERHYSTPRQLLPKAREAGKGDVPATELFTQEGVPYGPGFLPHETAPVEGHATPPEQPVSGPIELRDGARIEAVDGGIGRLDQLLLDTYTDQIAYLVVRGVPKGGPELRIPVEWVSYLDPGLIRLAANKKQVQQLVGPPAGNYLAEQGGG